LQEDSVAMPVLIEGDESNTLELVYVVLSVTLRDRSTQLLKFLQIMQILHVYARTRWHTFYLVGVFVKRAWCGIGQNS